MSFAQYILQDAEEGLFPVPLPEFDSRLVDASRYSRVFCAIVEGELKDTCRLLTRNGPSTNYRYVAYLSALQAAMECSPAIDYQDRFVPGDIVVLIDDGESADDISGFLSQKGDVRLLLDETGDYGDSAFGKDSFHYPAKGGIAYSGDMTESTLLVYARYRIAQLCQQAAQVAFKFDDVLEGRPYGLTYGPQAREIEIVKEKACELLFPLMTDAEKSLLWCIDIDRRSRSYFLGLVSDCLDKNAVSKPVGDLVHHMTAYITIWKVYGKKEGFVEKFAGCADYAAAAHEVGLDIVAESYREGLPMETLLGW